MLADAEVATLPFVYRFSLTLPHYRNIDPLKITADNNLIHVEQWIKVTSLPSCLPRHTPFLTSPEPSCEGDQLRRILCSFVWVHDTLYVRGHSQSCR